MLFSTWIDRNGGTLKTGKILGLKRNVVYAWRHQIALPRPALMKAIVKKSGGKVSYADIIEEYLDKRKSGPRRSNTVTVVLKRNGKLTAAGKALAKSKKVVDPGF